MIQGGVWGGMLSCISEGNGHKVPGYTKRARTCLACREEGGNRWLPQAYLTMGDLEPARGNLHVWKFLRDLANIKYARWLLEAIILSECVDRRTRCYNLEKEGRETEGRREQEKEGQKRSSQYALKLTCEIHLSLPTHRIEIRSLSLVCGVRWRDSLWKGIQESISRCHLRLLLTTLTTISFMLEVYRKAQ